MRAESRGSRRKKTVKTFKERKAVVLHQFHTGCAQVFSDVAKARLRAPQVTQLYVPASRHVWRFRRMGRIGPLQSSLDGEFSVAWRVSP